MKRLRPTSLVVLAMLAFAGNSVLCRLALKSTTIDPASFTTIRLVSGALVLWLVARLRPASSRPPPDRTVRAAVSGALRSGVVLFVYAATFSYAYVVLSTGTGALLLFGAVQVTMIAVGVVRGERFRAIQLIGLASALVGLTVMLLPGATAPSLPGALLMLVAGIAWGWYSLLGRRAPDPVGITARNFLVAAPLAIVLSVATSAHLRTDPAGTVEAVLSGAVTSGLGYVLWYTALPGLSATRAASVQLTVPVIAALGGAALLGEWPTLRFAVCAIAILGGIALVFARRPEADAAPLRDGQVDREDA